MEPKAYSYIRFSTPEQIKGDSIRRQTQYSEEVASKLGLTLDTSLALTDKGLSGYKGDHRTKGALGIFLKLVEDGEIPTGSVLIIEALDRLSREGMLEASHLMMGILLKGIDIYTAIDDKHFKKDTYDLADLIISATKLMAGHEESEKKSVRLKSAWDKKRNEAVQGIKKMTEKCPAWVKLSKDKKEFREIEVRAEAIRLIFRMKADGFGNEKIVRQLNELPDIWKPEKSKRNKTGGWRESYIQKILYNRSVIGEFQPHILKDGKRVPDGEPIKNYFPAVVDEDLFYSVHNYLSRLREANGHTGGRTGKVKNLFSHITKCGQCGGTMHYIDKGKPPKGAQYLWCDTSRRVVQDDKGNRVCNAKAIRYDEFEKIFFKEFDEFDINRLLPKPDKVQSEIKQIEETMSANRQRIKEMGQQKINLTDSIGRTQSSEVRKSLEDHLHKVIIDRVKLVNENKNLEQQKTDLQKESKEIRKQVDNVKEIHQLRQTMETEQELIDINTRLRGEIRKLIRQIDVYPLTEKYELWKKMDDEPGHYLHMTSRYMDKIRIRFHSGSDTIKRVIYLKRHAVEGGLDAGGISGT
ncbi:MAG: recombinase family protein [Balneolales bacterium]